MGLPFTGGTSMSKLNDTVRAVLTLEFGLSAGESANLIMASLPDNYAGRRVRAVRILKQEHQSKLMGTSMKDYLAQHPEIVLYEGRLDRDKTLYLRVNKEGGKVSVVSLKDKRFKKLKG